MNYWNKHAPDWARKFDQLVQNVGYGIANTLGLGEPANDLVNMIKDLFHSNTSTKSAAQLISYLKNKLGASSLQLQKIIALIDQKLGSLPAANSQNVKKALAGVRAQLMKQRRAASTELAKVEQTMNTAIGLAGQQDYLNPGKKQENQELIKEMAEGTNSDNIANSIERTL